jgi:hypothetical protein
MRDNILPIGTNYTPAVIPEGATHPIREEKDSAIRMQVIPRMQEAIQKGER